MGENKKYRTETMISNSRFKKLYETGSNERKTRVKAAMDKVKEEEAVYMDDKNIYWLNNLVTSIGVCLALEEEGMDRKRSVEMISDAMIEAVEPERKFIKKISKLPFFVPLIKYFVPRKMKRTAGYGWKVEFPKTGKYEFKMVVHECIYCQIFERQGIPELKPVFCNIDEVVYNDMPGADFAFTEQMGRGGRFCDYSFRRK